MVKPVVLFGGETWAMTEDMKRLGTWEENIRDKWTGRRTWNMENKN